MAKYKQWTFNSLTFLWSVPLWLASAGSCCHSQQLFSSPGLVQWLNLAGTGMVQKDSCETADPPKEELAELGEKTKIDRTP